MNSDQQTLGGFEQRLLDELKQVVVTREAVAAAPPRHRVSPGRWSPRRRLALALGAVGIATAAAVAGPTLLGSDHPAYAAERDPDGSIRIHIWEYRDAKGLQNRLRALGVDAVVDYVPNGKQCKPRATEVPGDLPNLLTTEPPPGDELAYWKLHPELIKPGQTFVFETTVWGDPRPNHTGTARGRYYLASGPVGPCELIAGGERIGPGGDAPRK